MKIEMRALSDVKAYEKNPRKNNNAIDAVAASIAEFGFRQPLVVDNDSVIIIGHTRWKAAQKLGLEKVPVHVADISKEKAAALRIADNKTNELAEWDFDLLDAELKSLEAVDFNLDVLGFEKDELKRLLDEPEEIEGEEDLPSPPAEPVSKPGCLYRLGAHRLICGDSSNPDDVARVLDGAHPDLMLTDPPYNVAYTGKTKDALKIENDSMGDEQYLSFLIATLGVAFGTLRPGASVYVWHADSEGLNVRSACRQIGLRVRQCLIWAKNSMVLGRQDYQWKHEPCLYGWKDGAAHSWHNDRSQTTILEFQRPSRSEDHPTMKPVDLFEYLIMNSSVRGELVIDPFGGSGTTMLAAERTGRRAALVELDPRFCDVIVRRWEQATGKKAVLESRP